MPRKPPHPAPVTEAPAAPPARRWLLTDTATGAWVETLRLDARQLGLDGADVAIAKRTLRGGRCDGVDLVEVRNGAFTFSVVPTRGMGLWRAACGSLRLGWDSPVNGPVHPSFVHPAENGGLGWTAGFDETMARCGLASNGPPCLDTPPGAAAPVPLTLHGRIANTPAHHVEVGVQGGARPELRVSGTVDEAAFFQPRLRLQTTYASAIGSPEVVVTDTVTNLQGTPAELALLYHCNFGPPLLEAGSRLLLPVREGAPRDARAAEDAATWPLYRGPAAGDTEQCHFFCPLGDGRGDTLALLENAARNRGVVVRFNILQLPCFTQWKCCQAAEDGYVTGLEPGTNFPNVRPFERRQGRLVRLAPGASFTASITLAACPDAAAVRRAEEEVRARQARSEAAFSPLPLPHLSP